MIDLDELEQLEKAATPGPWVVHWVQDQSGERLPCPLWDCFDEDNLSLTAAMRNALPELLRELRAARRCVELLRAAHTGDMSRMGNMVADAASHLRAYDEAVKGEHLK